MKFILSMALLAVAGVSAQGTAVTPSSSTSTSTSSSDSDSSNGCLAEYIVDRCLSTEQPKAVACSPTDYECQCAAYQAIATCYNNCPNDSRAAPAQQQVSQFCAQASLHNTKTSTTMTASMSTTTDMTATTTTTTDGTNPSNTAPFIANQPTETGGAGELLINTGGYLLAVAGVVGAVL